MVLRLWPAPLGPPPSQCPACGKDIRPGEQRAHTSADVWVCPACVIVRYKSPECCGVPEIAHGMVAPSPPRDLVGQTGRHEGSPTLGARSASDRRAVLLEPLSELLRCCAPHLLVGRTPVLLRE
jgi:hypothetical protein